MRLLFLLQLFLWGTIGGTIEDPLVQTLLCRPFLFLHSKLQTGHIKHCGEGRQLRIACRRERPI